MTRSRKIKYDKEERTRIDTLSEMRGSEKMSPGLGFETHQDDSQNTNRKGNWNQGIF